MNDDLLTPTEKGHTIEIDTTNWQRLEVEGRFVGWLDIWGGFVALYSRGKWAVYSIDELRKTAIK